MKKAFKLLLTAVVLLAGVLLFRAVRFPSRQIAVAASASTLPEDPAVADHLSRAIQFKTVSFADPSQTNSESFLGLHQYLETAFPKVHSALIREKMGDYSLLYFWKGSNPQLKPVLLLSHMDVVPVESESKWSYPPFEGRIAEGYIWGRGSLDDKVGVIGILEAAEMLLNSGFQPKRSIYLAFGADEEVGGTRGAARIARVLQSRHVQAEYILDEGGILAENVVPGITKPLAMIGIAEKGFVSLDLVTEAAGGHSSMPPDHSAIGVLAAAVKKVEDHPFPPRLTAVGRDMFSYIGPEMSFPKKILLANLWLFAPLVARVSTLSPGSNAFVRTTTAVTMIDGGVKENVLPERAHAVVNLRILPGDSVSTVLEHVRKIIDNPQVKVSVSGGFSSEPSFESDPRSTGFLQIQTIIGRVFPDAIVTPYLVVGGTDSRQYSDLSRQIFRFIPMRITPRDLERVHGIDERIAVKNYRECVEFYRQLIADN